MHPTPAPGGARPRPRRGTPCAGPPSFGALRAICLPELPAASPVPPGPPSFPLDATINTRSSPPAPAACHRDLVPRQHWRLSPLSPPRHDPQHSPSSRASALRRARDGAPGPRARAAPRPPQGAPQDCTRRRRCAGPRRAAPRPYIPPAPCLAPLPPRPRRPFPCGGGPPPRPREPPGRGAGRRRTPCHLSSVTSHAAPHCKDLTAQPLTGIKGRAPTARLKTR
jgi:hypothetical protein